MFLAPLLTLAFAAAPANECTDAAGWTAGRDGHAAKSACVADGYREAHRLGNALYELKREHGEIESRIDATATEKQGELRRRQRQIDIDLEAIRGVATVNHWPLDIAPEITP